MPCQLTADTATDSCEPRTLGLQSRAAKISDRYQLEAEDEYDEAESVELANNGRSVVNLAMHFQTVTCVVVCCLRLRAESSQEM